MSRAWQQQERLVAAWLHTTRNPLSGRNNRNDDGSKRLGDVLYRHAVIEVKRKKTVNMREVDSVRWLARVAKLPWALFEFKTGAADLVKITVNHATAEVICACLRKLWEQNPTESSDGGCVPPKTGEKR